MDLLVVQNEENSMAEYWANILDWKVGKTISFPGGKYITITDGLGLQNCHKLCGVLPRQAWPSTEADAPSTWVPFFYAPSHEDVHIVASSIQQYQGTVLLAPMMADGTVTILKDNEGAIFGYYHRTDDPNQIKG
jgi:hypothetical protein